MQEFKDLNDTLPRPRRIGEGLYRLSLPLGFASVVACILIAALTPIPGEAVKGVLSMEEHADTMLPSTFCPSIPSGSEALKGDPIGYRLACRHRRVLEKIAGMRGAKLSREMQDSLEAWQIELGDPFWMTGLQKGISMKPSTKELKALQKELQEKLNLLNDVRMEWNSAETEKQEADSRNLLLRLELDCNRLTSQIEDLVRRSERIGQQDHGKQTFLLGLAQAADSILHHALILAPADGVLKAGSFGEGRHAKEGFVFRSVKAAHYTFHTESAIPDYFMERGCFLRSGSSIFPIKVLGTEVGPQGSFLRISSVVDLPSNMDWELMVDESLSTQTLIRYWLIGSDR